MNTLAAVKGDPVFHVAAPGRTGQVAFAHLSEDLKHAGISVTEGGNTAGDDIRLGHHHAVSVDPQALAGQIDLYVISAKGQGIGLFVINRGVCTGAQVGYTVYKLCLQGGRIQV